MSDVIEIVSAEYAVEGEKDWLRELRERKKKEEDDAGVDESSMSVPDAVIKKLSNLSEEITKQSMKLVTDVPEEYRLCVKKGELRQLSFQFPLAGSVENLKTESSPSKGVEKSGVSVFFWDCKLALDHALALGKKYKVYYFVEWRTEYPKIENYMIGDGFDGIEKVRDLAKVGDVDLVVFSDVGYGGFADWLRGQDKAVFGASEKGELLELDRLYMAEVFSDLGIKTPKYVVAHGVDELRRTIREDGGKYFVKLNIFRGNLETFSVSNREELDTFLDKADFGIYRDNITFLVSEAIHGVEIGMDAFFNGREFLRPYFWGNEVKGAGSTFGKWVNESPFDDVLEKIGPWLAKAGYRGSISFEAIFDGSDLYVLDTTARLPFPGGSLLHYSIDNYADVVYAVARGEVVSPRPINKYFAQLPLIRDVREKSEWCSVSSYDETHVFFPRYAVKSRDTGEVWLLPSNETLGGVVCSDGSSLDDAISSAVNYGLAVESSGLSFSAEGIFKYQSYLDALRNYGVEW